MAQIQEMDVLFLALMSIPALGIPGHAMGWAWAMACPRFGMERLPQGGFADVRACAMAGEQIEAGYLQNVHRVSAHFSVGWKPAIWHLAFYLAQ